MRTVWTNTKKYVNSWKFMRTGVNRKHTLVSVTLKKYVTWCEPAENIVWTSANRHGKFCEPVWTVVRTNWKSAPSAAYGRIWTKKSGIPLVLAHIRCPESRFEVWSPYSALFILTGSNCKKMRPINLLPGIVVMAQCSGKIRGLKFFCFFFLFETFEF